MKNKRQNCQRLLALVLAATNLISISYAFSPTDLWYTRDQQGQKAFNRGDFAKAATQFQNAAWQGSAEYNNKNFEAAYAQFSKHSQTSDDFYNQGNALAHLGRYEDSIAAYDQALQQDPSNQDAKENREIVKKLLQKQKQNPDQKNKPDQKPKQKSDHNQKSNSDPQPKPSDKKDSEPKQPENNNQTSDQKQNQNKGHQEEQKKNEPKQGEEKPEQAAKPQPSKINPQDKQWLAQIPEDPGGLLKQKFLRDHERVGQGN